MKHFLDLTLCGQTWACYYVSQRECDAVARKLDLEDDGNEGLCDYATQKIYVVKSRQWTRTRDRFLHEVCHAFLEASGVGSLLEEHYKGPLPFHKWEESLIRLFVPHFATAIDHWTGQQKT